MTLREFNDINVTTKASYTVFYGKKRIDSFVVDYIGDIDSTHNLIRLMEKGAEVEFVSVNSVTNILEVTVKLPSQKKGGNKVV